MTTQPQTAPPNVDDLLMGSGDGPSAPFLKMGPATLTRPAHTAPGEWKGGRIVSVRPTQAHKLGPVDRQTGKPVRIPQVYQSGAKKDQPIWNVLVVLETNERDPQIDGDEGRRSVELDGFDRYWELTADFDCRKRAARLAVTAAGATGLEVGGELYLTWTRQVPLPGVSTPATHWEARYRKPAQSFTFEQPVAPAAPAPAREPFNLGQVAQQAVAQAPAGPIARMPVEHAARNEQLYQAAQQAPATPQGQPLPAEPPF